MQTGGKLKTAHEEMLPRYANIGSTWAWVTWAFLLQCLVFTRCPACIYRGAQFAKTPACHT